MWYRLRLVLWAGVLGFGIFCLSPLPAAHAQQAASVGVGDTVLDLSGQTSPNAFISVYKGSSLIGTLTAGSDGSFSQVFPAQEPGITRLNLSAKDTENRLSDTASLEVNLQQHFPTAVYFFMPPTMDVSSSVLTGGQPLRLEGHTVPNGSVTVYVDSQIRATVTAGVDGIWSATLQTSDISTGLHGVFARVSDGGGMQSFPTRTQSFIINRETPPPLPIPTTPPITLPPIFRVAPDVPTILSPSQDYTSSQSRIVVSGQGPRSTQIEIWEGQQIIGSVWSDNRGSWEIPLTFSSGSHSIRSRSCLDGQCSRFSDSINITYRPQAVEPSRLRARLEQHTFKGVPADKDGKISLRLHIVEGGPEYAITVDWGDGTQTTDTRVTRTIVFEHSYQKTGRYSGKLIVRNPLDSQELFFSVHIEINNVNALASPPALAAYSALALIAVFTLLRFLTIRRKRNNKQ